MKLFSNINCCFAVLLFALTLSAGTVFSDQNVYILPASILLTIEKSPNDNICVGTIESRFGNLKSLEIFIDSSPDIKAVTPSQKLEFLAEKSKHSLNIEIVKNQVRNASATARSELGSWIKMRVSYIPDFDALFSASLNPASYPNTIERERLQKIIEENRKKSEPYTDAVRIFLD
ncbi:MAG: hypothetical protein HQM10_26480 [Candidatus Riflebacteria bacterium]|nr:hypothetical protein [Candidatus Riflebacteria bacterium]